MKHVLLKILPVLNGAAMQPAWRARASRRTGGKLIMWKMRAVASVRGADGMPLRGVHLALTGPGLTWNKTSSMILHYVCQLAPSPRDTPTTLFSV